jgi:hypothetical protein
MRCESKSSISAKFLANIENKINLENDMPVSPLRHCPNRMINFLAHLVDELVEKRAEYVREPFYTKKKSERYDTQSSFTRKSRRKSRMFTSAAPRPWGNNKLLFKSDL